MLNINKISNALKYGGARPNLFKVSLTVPEALQTLIGNLAKDNFTYMCQAAQLPPSTLGSVTVPYMGREYKVAGNRTFGDWTVTVMNDEDFDLKVSFEAWMAAINGHVHNVRAKGATSNPMSYKANAKVDQYTKEGDIAVSYSLYGMFPTSVGAIELNWGTNNTIETFGVTFAYDYWVLSPAVQENVGSDTGTASEGPLE